MKLKRYLPYLLPALALFFLLSPLQGRINRLRVEEELIETDIFAATTPSDVWGVLLLAGFRGVAVNMLWMRAMELQMEGEFFELLTLQRLITTLQPRFLRVWTHTAWNMAYNISRLMGTLEEEWVWIEKAIELMEEGIQRNPRSWDLPFFLGWIYFHKCADVEAEGFFKAQLEKEGKNNWELAAYWFERATEHPPYPWYVDQLIGHALGRRAEQARRAGDIEIATEFTRRTLLRWRKNMEKYPDMLVVRDNYLHWKQRLGVENP